MKTQTFTRKRDHKPGLAADDAAAYLWGIHQSMDAEKEYEMNQNKVLSGSKKAQSAARPIVWMVKALLPVFVLALALALAGRVSAAPATDSNTPNCGGQPICNYLQAHNNQQVGAVPAACGELAICAYIQAHNQVEGDLVGLLRSQPQPAALIPQLTLSQTALVHSGPGADYYSYGELPARYVSAVLASDADAAWWVIPLPVSVAPDGLGWVEASAVKASNVVVAAVDLPACGPLPECGYLIEHSKGVPIGEMACAGLPICGYLQAHMSESVPVVEPSYLVEYLLREPIISVSGR